MAVVTRSRRSSMACTRHVALAFALLASGCSALIDSDDVRFEAPAGERERSAGHEADAAASEDLGRTLTRDETHTEGGAPLDPTEQQPDSGPTAAPPIDDGGPPDAQVPLDADTDGGTDAGTPPTPVSPLAPELILTSLHVMR